MAHFYSNKPWRLCKRADVSSKQLHFNPMKSLEIHCFGLVCKDTFLAVQVIADVAVLGKD